MTDVLAVATVATPVLAAVVLPLAPSRRALVALNLVAALTVAGLAVALSVGAFTDVLQPSRGRWYVVDPATAVYLVVIATIGLLSALLSPSYLGAGRAGFFAHRRSGAAYFAAFYLFWAALLAVALVDNLAIAWVLIEATTAASALLVAFSGRPNALEAGWKYLVLTTLGLAVALLGIIVLYAATETQTASIAALDWASLHRDAATLDHDGALLALVLIIGGLAAKVGWAPVHNWLPDAHSEAPPPVSALLSAALLPTVMLVAWRAEVALRPATGDAGGNLFILMGLGSLVIAVPFLWRRMPIKRLLAYSSLEHMGILALGIGFAHPLATAGVVLHVGGHALAKALGFYATIPLLQADPQLADHAPRGLGARTPAGATAVGVSLFALSGLPPSPLFCSEVLILLGGIASGHTLVVVAASVVLALAFLGLAHALIDGLITDRIRGSILRPRVARRLAILTSAIGAALLGLTATVVVLPGSAFVEQLMGGITR